MKRARKTLPIFLLVLVQSALAIIIGVAVLFRVSLDTVPAGALAGDLFIGGMSCSDAVQKIESYYSDKLKLHILKLELEDGKTYEIPFSDIEAKVDGNATLNTLKSVQGLKDIPNLFNNYFGHGKLVLQPVVRFNEGKLRMELAELAEKIYIVPKDASISYYDGIIKRKAETDGISLNVSNAVEEIRKQLSAAPWESVKLTRTNNSALQVVEPSKKLKDYEDIQQVLSEYTTQIIDSELTESIKLAADSINGAILPAAVNVQASPVFSFTEKLKSKNVNIDNDNEGYDLVASTLYAALLTAGLPVDCITRLPHKLPVDYIDPGLDAWISESTADLKFNNPYGHQLAVFVQVEGSRVKVAIAGSMSDKKEKYEIRTEITQKFAPPVFYVEDKSLKPGEKIVLNPGKEGILVNVYRNDELIGLGPDKYDAEKTIIQISPDSSWSSNDK
ncbi:MAG: VanW family protein [Clostridiaceae bacterium]